MGFTTRISLPTYNAKTDTNLDHYALYADQDNILIKEQARGAISAVNGSAVFVNHNLGYVPLAMVFYQSGSQWNIVTGDLIDNYSYCIADNTALYIFGPSGGTTTVNFKYFIFYDQQ